MSKRVHRFPLSSITASLHIKRHICAHALVWPYPSDSYKASLVFQTTTHTGQCGLLHVLFISSLPQHAALPLSLPLSLSVSVTHCGFLEYIFGLLDSWCSVSQLLLALTQHCVLLHDCC
ncbi:unnamed protein product [Hymenolepis diminuta]|uniref:Uncharacterized protein n=1 Tax=Hymenolepis diminuta TaxID=6216 RepID=A0A564Z400_HYMDI|nr:unnamed protein product [Hymenolepis diminuta]